MTKKLSYDSWLGVEEEANWCDSMVNPTGMHLIPSWEIKTPAPSKEIIWGTNRIKPLTTIIGLKQASEISVETKNAWNFRQLYLLASGGAFANNSGTITFESGIRYFSLHGYNNGTPRTYIGCVMEEFGINIPEKGGNIYLDYKAIGADFTGMTHTKPSAITNSLKTEDMTVVIENSGVVINDVFQGGRLSFKEKIITEVPDLSNNRIYEPCKGNLEVVGEFKFRLDDSDNFLLAYESGSTGVFDMSIDIKKDSTGIYVEMSGLQIEDFTEPVPTAEVGIVEQTVQFVSSEDFILNPIQITGVDFT